MSAEEEAQKMLREADLAAAKTETLNDERDAGRALVSMYYSGRNRIEAAGILTEMSRAFQDIDRAECSVEDRDELKNLFKAFIVSEAVSEGSERGSSRKKRHTKGGLRIFGRILELFSKVCSGIKDMKNRVERLLEADIRRQEERIERTANDEELAKKIAGYIRNITMTVLSLVAVKVISHELSLGTSGIVGIVSRLVLNGVLVLIPDNSLSAISGVMNIVRALGDDVYSDVTGDPKKYAAFAAAAALSLPFTNKRVGDTTVSLGKRIIQNIQKLLEGNASANILNHEEVVSSIEALTEALEGLQIPQPGSRVTRSQVAAAAAAAKAAAEAVVLKTEEEPAGAAGAAEVKEAIKGITALQLVQLRDRYKQEFRERIEAAAVKAVDDAGKAALEAAKEAAKEAEPKPEPEGEPEGEEGERPPKRGALSPGVDEGEPETKRAALSSGVDEGGRRKRTRRIRKRKSFKKNKRRYSKKRIHRG